MSEYNAAEETDFLDVAGTEPTETALEDVERLADEAEAEAESPDEVLADAGIDDQAEFGDVEPGAEGPVGTGIEGADDALLAANRQTGADAPDLPDTFGTDDSTAAEQGNRVGDEMVADDSDPNQVAQLAGDDLDVDALADDGIREVDVIDGMPEVIDNADNQN